MFMFYKTICSGDGEPKVAYTLYLNYIDSNVTNPHVLKSADLDDDILRRMLEINQRLCTEYWP